MNTKPVQVVMLPQVKNNTIFPAIAQVHCLNNKIQLCENGLLRTPCTYNHLYFISTDPNEEIKEGDWVYDTVLRKTYRKDAHFVSVYEKKIIASTDPSLGLPAIPLNWIRDVYVPSNGFIKEVRLGIYTTNDCPEAMFDSLFSEFTWYQTYVGKLKLAPNNEVVIVDEPEVNGWSMKELAQTAVSMLEKQFEAIEQKSVDQELEDAAKSHIDAKMGGSKYRLESPNDAYITARMQSFKDGATWKAEQSANDAIELLNWLRDDETNYYLLIDWIQTKKSSKDVYELWQQNKKK